MGKLVGCLCILFGCMSLLYGWKSRMRRRIECMQEIIRFLNGFEQMLDSRQMRLPEFFQTYPFTVPALRELGAAVAEGLRMNRYPTGTELWQRMLKKHRPSLDISEEAYRILFSLSDGFFGMGRKQALLCVQSDRKRFEQLLKEERDKYKEKCRVYVPVGMLTGVMVMILLV